MGVRLKVYLELAELWDDDEDDDDDDAFLSREPDHDDLDSVDNKRGNAMVKMVMELNGDW